MDKGKVVKVATGSVMLGAGVCLRLAEMDLSVSEVILSGAKNLTNEFVQAPDLKIGETLLVDIKKETGKYAKKLIAKGRGFVR